MRIAIITSRYPSRDNPYNHMFVHMRAVEMVKRGISLTVFVPSSTRVSYEHELVNVRKLEYQEIIYELIHYDIAYLHLLNIYPFSKRNGWPIYKHILKSNLPCAIYVHGSEVQKYRTRSFEFNYRISDFLTWIKKDIFVIPKIKKFVRNTKDRKNIRYIFPSAWMKKDMEYNLNTKLSTFSIIPNGIDTELFKFHSLYNRRHKALTVRPLSSKKYAVDKAIKTMRFLPDSFTLEIFGKGDYKNEYIKLIEKLNLTERIKIREEFIDRKDLNSLFSNYGILLMPTRMDAQGVSMCEGMASGLLVCSSNNTAIPEFIKDMNNGILGNDEEILAKKIMKVVSDKDLFSRITEEGRASMQKISISKTVSSEIQVLSNLLPN